MLKRKSRWLARFVAISSVLLLGIAHAEVSPFGAVRTILESKCIECHGGKFERASLNLSTHESLLRGGESGSAIVAGDAKASLLYKKITHADEPGMPYKREKLSDAEIAQLAKWINAGAVYEQPLTAKAEKIWSLQPLKKSEPPKTKNKSWAKTPIDQFVLAKLEEKGMEPSPPADKRTLLRRVTFDLIGLPPTPEEMRDFLSDDSSNAFEKVVDRLLASPRYGERWARHWLDAVHYADTHGHDQDLQRPNAWPYRDYLIGAFNMDKPYARFVEEQLAGDILFPEEPEGIVATGFIVAGPWDASSQMFITDDTVDKKMARNLDRDDMVMTTMSTFVSSTVHCARCHNHKFDPILQSEYYNLQAVFAGVDRADRPYDLDPSTNMLRQTLLRKKTALDVKDKKLIDSLLVPDMQAKVAAWEKTMPDEKMWTVLDPMSFTSSNGVTLTKQKDFSILASGESPKVDTYTIVAKTDLKGVTAVRLEVLTDASHPRNGPGRQPENGNFHLSEFRVAVAQKENLAAPKAVSLQNASADFSQDNWPIAKALDGDTNTAWGVFPETGKPHLAVFELKENLTLEEGATLIFTLEQLHGREHTILRPRISVTTAARPVRVDPLPENIKKILAVAADQRSKEQKIELAAYYLKGQIEKEIAALPPPLSVFAAANDFPPQGNFTPSKIPRQVHLLKRGDILKLGDAAIPGALSCVSEIPSQFELPDPNDEGARRTALAKWITNPKNVLAWRSIVNRVWHYHFGKGIVDTPGDFGEMGSKPTHPELLDWLAIWFQENGGSMKKLHRLILTSAVYQQSSQDNPAFSKIDSGNFYLWRMNRNRLDAESIRDGVLQITGKLNLKMGGPPVQQFVLENPIPSNTPIVDYNRFDVDKPENFRRSIYRYLYRSLPDPFMDTLDCADPSQLTPVRNISMTALQALALWNDALMVRQSEHFAARLAEMNSDLEKQIIAAYDLALGRAPKHSELEVLKDYAKEHGMANACRVILNSNEFIFVN
ncbi:MAG: PSD1 and planctomycete cytochrome C domain-containing protein [Verrucomicrobiota bacterium]